jgi:hypothetical protein
VAPTGYEAATRAAASVLGLDTRTRRRTPSAAAVRDLSAAAVDVARRVNAVLGVRAGNVQHATALAGLLPLLEKFAAGTTAGPELTVPVSAQDWAHDRAQQMAVELTAGGYPVHGSLAGVLPRLGGLATHPRREDALEVVLSACARLAGRAEAVEGAVSR